MNKKKKSKRASNSMSGWLKEWEKHYSPKHRNPDGYSEASVRAQRKLLRYLD
jgi:hypothetical protein